MGNVTIKTLAKELQVSVATVSKALKDSYDIGPATKQRVLEMADKLNYVPNPYAGSLRKRKSKTIAIVLPEVADSFFSLAINGIEAMAQEKGYHVLVYLTHESFEKEKAILKDFQSGRVDGVLISLTSETTSYEHIEELCSRGTPVVFFDRVCEEMPTAKITTDDFDAGYLAARHLIEKSCSRLSFLSISNSLSISNNRMEGFLQALKDQGHKIIPSTIVMCSNDSEKNLSVVKKLLAARSRPDGIVATVEKLITPVYLACSEAGLSIPQHVKVIGFSNLPTAPILNPSLTTITQPAFEIGKAASSVLFKALSKPGFLLQKESMTIKSVLSVRGSTQ
ncbi:MAG TPA: LacI family DNA-binding transcriptional regulator [Flavisolibacter sp.]|nr:LacI family DNA-binding transcriptional regulator [Flavisolibacter sp.]